MFGIGGAIRREGRRLDERVRGEVDRVGDSLTGGDAPQVQETAYEREYALMVAQKWDQYVQTGVPIENEYIRRVTGYARDPQTGEWGLDSSFGSPLDADGNIKTDTSEAHIASERAATADLYGGNPDEQNATQMHNDQSVFAQQGGASAANMGLQQQTNYLQGVQNVAGMGQGRAAEALTTQQQMSQQAQQDAISAASQAQASRQQRRGMIGQAAGVAGSMSLRRYETQNQTPGKMTSYGPNGIPREF